MNKKKYIEPKMKVIVIDSADIVCQSPYSESIEEIEERDNVVFD